MHSIHNYFNYMLTVSRLLWSHTVGNNDSCCMGGIWAVFLSFCHYQLFDDRVVIGEGALLLLHWYSHEFTTCMCWRIKNFSPSFFFFQSRWARITWMDTKAWALSERGFPWLPHCHRNSYYCLPVLLPVNPAAEAYEGKTWFSGIVACNILQKNWGVLHDAHLRSYVRPVQSPEQFRRVRVQTLLKVPLNMAQTWCSGPLRGADLIYCLTADCTTVAFPRVICSVQAMEVNYDLHKCSWKAAKINK